MYICVIIRVTIIRYSMCINIYKCKKCFHYNFYIHLLAYIHFPFPSGKTGIIGKNFDILFCKTTDYSNNHTHV